MQLIIDFCSDLVGDSEPIPVAWSSHVQGMDFNPSLSHLKRSNLLVLASGPTVNLLRTYSMTSFSIYLAQTSSNRSVAASRTLTVVKSDSDVPGWLLRSRPS